jgi:hypothetical protein
MRWYKYLFVIFLSGVGMMTWAQGCSSQPDYKKYSSKDSELNVEMDHSVGWDFNETRGAYGSYAQVIFLEPAKKDKPLRATMVFVTQRSAKVEFQPATLEGFVEDLRKQGQSLKRQDLWAGPKTRGWEQKPLSLIFLTA